MIYQSYLSRRKTVHYTSVLTSIVSTASQQSITIYFHLSLIYFSVLILTYQISNAQLIVETNALNYALTIIFSIINEENEVYPVVFHFYTFTTTELNYDTYNKKLLAIFKAFKLSRESGSLYQCCYSLQFYLVIISALVILVPNWMLLLDSRIFTVKKRILTMIQLILTTSN